MECLPRQCSVSVTAWYFSGACRRNVKNGNLRFCHAGSGWHSPRGSCHPARSKAAFIPAGVMQYPAMSLPRRRIPKEPVVRENDTLKRRLQVSRHGKPRRIRGNLRSRSAGLPRSGFGDGMRPPSARQESAIPESRYSRSPVEGTKESTPCGSGERFCLASDSRGARPPESGASPPGNRAFPSRRVPSTTTFGGDMHGGVIRACGGCYRLPPCRRRS
jgi:hypothetical protein